MSTIANLLIKIGVDVNDASRDLNKFGGKAGSTIRKSFLPAIGILTGVGIAAKAGFSEFVGAQKVTAQTGAALKSTGNAANTSIASIQGLSGALMTKSGVDDEVIQSGANLLLTFTKVRNEVGAGNAIFDQATSAALDMSVAMGTDMRSASLQLGKALNDPTKGVTKLARAGVQFSDAQIKSIKTMQASGNIMGAQKVILGELETQFGGSAAAAGKTFSGQVAIAQQTLSNLAGSLVAGAIPALTALAAGAGVAATWMTNHETATKVLVGTIAGLATAVVAANVALRLQAAGSLAVAAAKGVATAATKAWTAAQWLLNAALSGNPIALVIIAIAGLAAGIVIAYRNSETFRNVVKGAFDVAKVAINAVKTAVEAVVSAIVAAKDHPVVGGIKTYYVTQFNLIKGAIQAVITAVEAIAGAVRAAKDSKAVQAIGGAFGSAFGAAASAVGGVTSAVNTLISAINTALSLVAKLSGNSARAHAQARALQGNGGAGGGIPATANGGIFNGAQVRLIGEAGPEAVVPLNRPHRAAEIMKEAGLAGGGGPSINIETMVVQDATDIDRVAARLGRQLMMAG